jgi:hypothetical protein
MSQPKQAGSSPAVKPPKPDFLNDWQLRVEEGEEAIKAGAWRKAALPAAIAGIMFAVLYFLSYYLLAQTPLGNATDAEIIDYYAGGNNLTLTLAGMLVMPFAGIAFLYFMMLLRTTARATGFRFSRVLSNIQQATGIIFVAMLFVATAGLVATPASMQFANAQTDPLAARILPLFSTTVLLGFGMRMASMFAISSTSIGKATGIIPSWFAWIGYIVGVLLLLSFSFATWFAALFAVWVIALCIILLVGRSRRG